jgi:hypothetical protein
MANKKALILLIIVILLGGGVAYAYTQGLISLGGAPYDTENLASSIFKGFAKIKTASYSLNLTVFSEPKDADALPYSAAVPSNPVKDQSYQRDVDKARDLNTVLQGIMSYYYKSKSYPASISSLDTQSQTAAKNVTYTGSSDQKDYTITVTFETSDAVGVFSKMAQSYGNNAIKIDGKTVTMKRDAGSYIYLPSTPPQPFLATLFGLQSYASLIPGNFKLDGTISGSSEKTNDNKINSKIHLGGTVDLGDVNMAADAEFRKVASDYYIVLNKFPSVGFDLTKIKGKWIKITEQEALSYGGNYLGSGNTTEDAVAKAKAEFTQELNIFLTTADKDHVLQVDGSPKHENLNGTTAFKYDLQFNKTAFPQFYKDLVQAFTEKYPEKKILIFDQSTLDYLQSPEFDQAFDYFHKNTTLSLWADANGVPLQFRYGLRIVPESKTNAPADRQVKLTFTLSLTDINKDVGITAPANTMTLEDATTAITGQSKEEYRFSRQNSNISNLRYALTTYKSLAGTYPTSLDDLKKPRRDVEALNPAGGQVKVTSLPGSYDSLPVLAAIPLDVYTNAPYTYAKNGADYTLTYTITLPPYTAGNAIPRVYSQDYSNIGGNYNTKI